MEITMGEKTKDVDIFDLHSLPDDMKESLAKKIAEHTFALFNTAEQVVPIRPKDVLSKHVAKVALCGREELVGFAGAAKVGQYRLLQMSKVGGLFVLPSFTGNGLGLELLNGVTTEVLKQDGFPFAFCSPTVEHLFHAASYIPARPADIPHGQVSHFPHRNRAWIYYNGIPSHMYAIWKRAPYTQAGY